VVNTATAAAAEFDDSTGLPVQTHSIGLNPSRDETSRGEAGEGPAGPDG
jgi:hypothetical protein